MPDMGTQWIGTRAETAGAVTASTLSTALTVGNSNAKSGWTQVIASTAFDYAAILIQIGLATTAFRYMVDIGIGAGGSEVVLIANLYTADAGVDLIQSILIPISIPAGTRISVRGQTSATSGTNQIYFQLIGVAANPRLPVPMGRVTTYGATTASTSGVSLDPGGTANTKGAWSQIVASTTYDITWLVIMFGHNAAASTGGPTWLIDIGVGAAASEVVTLANLFSLFISSGFNFTSPICIPLSVPAGTRLSARCQCSVNTATVRLIDVMAYGVS